MKDNFVIFRTWLIMVLERGYTVGKDVSNTKLGSLAMFARIMRIHLLRLEGMDHFLCCIFEIPRDGRTWRTAMRIRI